MKLSYFGVTLAVAVLATGCGGASGQPEYPPQTPLNARMVTAPKLYRVSERCSQGPLVLTVPAIGSTWGETITITARGEPISLQYDVWAGGERLRDRWPMQSQDDRGTPLPPTRGDCLLPTTPNQGPGAWGPQLPPGQGGGLGGGSNKRQASFVATDRQSQRGQARASISFKKEVRTWGQVGFSAGAQITFVFYSDLPNDFVNVVFEVSQAVLEPPNHEAYKQELWVSKLQADAKEAALRERGRQCALNMDASCRAEGWRYASEVPAQAPLANGGGLPQTVTASKTPTSPPPPGRAEAIPPKPTAGSVWVNGYYVWDGFAWVWASGAYRIPPEDLRPPPSPPPPPPATEPTRPAAGGPFAQWVAGRWVFTATGWVWLPGRLELR